MIARFERKGKRPSWESPVPLSSHPRLPEFPVDALPPWLCRFVVQTTESFQVPAEFPALYALALISAAVCGKYLVHIREQWEIPLTLYVLVAMPPGERKSPVHAYMTKPFQDWDFNNSVLRATERSRAQALEQQTRALADAALADVKRSRGSDDFADLSEAHVEASAKHAEALEAVPVDRRSLVEFVTPEALELAMHANGGKQAIISDEGAGVFTMTGRYSRFGGANLELLLKAYDGVRYTPGRVTRSAPPIERALLTIAFGIQPEAVKKAVASAPEIHDRGFVARFLVAMPSPRVGTRRVRTSPVSKSAETRYQNNLTLLLEIPDQVDHEGKPVAAVLKFSRKARAAMTEFQERMEDLMDPGAHPEHLIMWLAKLAGQVGRLAGLLHLADHVETSTPSLIRSRTVLRAIRIVDCLIPHACSRSRSFPS